MINKINMNEQTILKLIKLKLTPFTRLHKWWNNINNNNYIVCIYIQYIYIKLLLKICYCLLFYQKIQPVDSEYKEGREYVLQQFIKEGSYGEVHIARDVNTGFRFAVKKVKQSILLPSLWFFFSTALFQSVLTLLFHPFLTGLPEEVQQWGGGCVECPQISSCGEALWSGQRGAQRPPLHGPQIW